MGLVLTVLCATVCGPDPLLARPQGIQFEGGAQSRGDEIRLRLDEVADAIDRGRADRARTLLSEIADSAAYRSLLSGGGPEVDATLARISSQAKSSGAHGVMVRAGEERVARLARDRKIEDPGLLRAQRDLGIARFMNGDLNGAVSLFEHVYETRRRTLDEEDPLVLEAAQSLGVALRSSGHVDRAHALFEQVLWVREARLDPGDLHLAAARQNLALARRDLGDLAGALELEEKAVDILERALHPDHPRVVGLKVNLGWTRRALQDLTGARSLFEEALAVRERALPASHPDLLDVQEGLGLTLSSLGEPVAAYELLEAVHSSRAERLAPDHADRLRAELNLAIVLRSLGQAERARPLVEHVLAVRERRFGSDHPRVLDAQAQLGWTWLNLGDPEKGQALFEQVLGAIESGSNPSAFVLDVKEGLGRCCLARADVKGADALFRSVREARSRALPDDHPSLLRVELALAETRRALTDLEGSLSLAQHVVQVRERTLHEDNPGLVAAREQLALTLHATGDLEAARSLFEQVYASRVRTCGTDDPALVSATRNVAIARYVLGDLVGALPMYEAVHEARRRACGPDDPDLMAARQDLAGILQATGERARALELMELVLESRERTFPDGDAAVLMARWNVAAVRAEAADAREMLDGLEALHARIDETCSPLERLSAKKGLGAILFQLGESARALTILDEAHRLAERILPPIDDRLAVAKRSLATARRAEGDFIGALELEEELFALRTRRLAEDAPEVLREKLALAERRKKAGRYRDALALEREAVDVLASRNDEASRENLLLAKRGLALTYKQLGEFAPALALEDEVLRAREQTLAPGDPRVVDAKSCLAGTLRAIGELEESQELFELVSEAYRRTLPENDHELLLSELNLASVLVGLGDYERARHLVRRVLRVWGSTLPESHPDRIRAAQSLGNILTGLGDVVGAHEQYEHVEAVLSRSLPPEHTDVLYAKSNLATTTLALGDAERGLDLSEEVLRGRERTFPSEHPYVLAAKVNLAIGNGFAGHYDTALELAEEAYETCRQALSEDHDLVHRAALALALARWESGQHDGLVAVLETFLAQQRRIVEGLVRQSPRQARAMARNELAMLEGIAGMGDFVDPGTDLDSVVFRNLEGLRLASSWTTGVAMRAARRIVELSSTLAELERHGRRIAAAGQATAVRSSEDLERWRDDLILLSEERERVERRVRSVLLDHGVRVDVPDVAEIAHAIGAGSALVSFWCHRRIGRQADGETGRPSTDSLLAFTLTPEGRVRRLELGPIAAVEEAIREWRDGLHIAPDARSFPGMGVSAPEPAASEGSGERLRKLLLDPILELFPDVERLQVVLDDVLYLVPLDALPLGDGVIGDRISLHLQTSVGPIVRQAPGPRGGHGLVAVGGIDYAEWDAEDGERITAGPMQDPKTSDVTRPPLASLPGTLEEVESISSIYRSVFGATPTVLSGRRASKERLLEVAPSARYLHIGTHGWFVDINDMPADLGFQGPRGDEWCELRSTLEAFVPATLSGLALAGAGRGRDESGRFPGILTAEELVGIDLSACELAVLSACETNVGIRRAGQGIQSLQTALHAAGARTAITSLWKVDDDATRILMEQFYTYLWSGEMGKADALWKAKCDLREEGHPVRDWAAWVLSGDPN